MWWAIVLVVAPGPSSWRNCIQGVPVARALGWFVGNYGRGIAGRACIRSFRKRRAFVGRHSRAHRVPGFGVLGAPLLTSFLDVAVVQSTGPGRGDYWMLWMTRLSSNMIANLTVVPTVCFFWRNGTRWLRKATFERWVEACSWRSESSLSASLSSPERGYSTASHVPALVFSPPLPFLLWAAIRFGTGALSVVHARRCIHRQLERGPRTSVGSLGIASRKRARTCVFC